VRDEKLLDASKLLKADLIVIGRNEDNEILSCKCDIDKSNNNEKIYIRLGQLNGENKLTGIGRKIHL